MLSAQNSGCTTSRLLMSSAARVRAIWGWIELIVAQPTAAAGIHMSHDRRGFIFAVGCQADPTRCFTDGRRLTPAGVERARRMLCELIHDYRAVRPHSQVIAELWLRATGLIRSVHHQAMLPIHVDDALTGVAAGGRTVRPGDAQVLRAWQRLVRTRGADRR